MRRFGLIVAFFVYAACGAAEHGDSCSRDAAGHRVARLYYLAQAESVDVDEFYMEQSELRSYLSACHKIGSISVPMLGTFSEMELLIIADDIESLMRFRKQDLLTASKVEGGSAPLIHLAAAFSSPTVMQYLIDIGADPLIRDRFENYAISAACNSAPERERIVEMLALRGVPGACRDRQ